MLIKNYKKLMIMLFCCTHILIRAFSAIPVIIIHSGYLDGLQDALFQAKHCNERVILIGDESNKHYAQNGIEYYPITDFNTSSTRFSVVYRHMSNSAYQEELSRFTRWFILEEFMKKNNIPLSFYAESNIMLYCDVSREYQTNFNDYDLGLEVQHGFFDGLLSYWSLKAIESFCSYLTIFYEDIKSLDILEDQFNLGGEQYHDDWPHMTNWVHDTTKLFKTANLNTLMNNATFDSSFSNDYILVPNAASVLEYRRYRMISVNGNDEHKQKTQKLLIKDILWNRGIPYCYCEDLGTFIKFKALQFQDNTRSLMAHYKSIPQIDLISSGPYHNIDILPFYMLGFFSLENRRFLEGFIKKYKPEAVVDLGSWLGASASYMAFFMPENSKVYAVDYFNSALDHFIEDSENIKHAALTLDISPLHYQFLSNIIHYNLCDKIIPVKMSSLQASRSLAIKADLIYMDASTDEESVYQDIMHWYPKLNKGGIICGENWKWFEGVQRGVSRAAKELGKTVRTDNNFWYFDLADANA